MLISVRILGVCLFIFCYSHGIYDIKYLRACSNRYTNQTVPRILITRLRAIVASARSGSSGHLYDYRAGRVVESGRSPRQPEARGGALAGARRVLRGTHAALDARSGRPPGQPGHGRL